MRPEPPAIGFGHVWHRRNVPLVHEFRYPTIDVWVDPDRPDDLCRHHPWWSTGRWRPVQLRRTDYFDGGDGPVGPAVRELLAEPLGVTPAGPVRMLTQPRTWGSLFNPITAYLVWDRPDADPVGAVLEVTNTPWKERHHYPVALAAGPTGPGLGAEFDKRLHVSPFLDADLRYRLRLRSDRADHPAGRPGPWSLTLTIDVIATDPALAHEAPIVETALRLDLVPPTRKVLTCALTRTPFPTRRVSLGIHTQAARLALKGVPFVPHPVKRPPGPTAPQPEHR